MRRRCLGCGQPMVVIVANWVLGGEPATSIWGPYVEFMVCSTCDRLLERLRPLHSENDD